MYWFFCGRRWISWSIAVSTRCHTCVCFIRFGACIPPHLTHALHTLSDPLSVWAEYHHPRNQAHIYSYFLQQMALFQKMYFLMCLKNGKSLISPIRSDLYLLVCIVLFVGFERSWAIVQIDIFGRFWGDILRLIPNKFQSLKSLLSPNVFHERQRCETFDNPF